MKNARGDAYCRRGGERWRGEGENQFSRLGFTFARVFLFCFIFYFSFLSIDKC